MFNKLISKLNGNKKNVIKITIGTVVGQLISVITLPFITRLYGAEIIGFWAFLNSIAVIVKSYSDLGLTNSIMLEEEEEIEDVYKVITTIVTIISIASSVIVAWIFVTFSSFEINPIFLLFYLIALVFTIQQIQLCYTWLNRKCEYGILMKNPIINNGINSTAAILLGFLGMGLYGYLVGNMIGQIITLLYMKRSLPKSMFTFKLTDFAKIVSNNKRFVTYQLPTNVISNFKDQLPTLLIQGLWGSQALGYYSITVRVLQIPSTFLANSIGRVFFQTTSKLIREGKSIGEYVTKNLKLGMMFAILPITILMALGDKLAILAFGKEWQVSGEFIRLLAIQYFFMFISNTVYGLSTVLEKQNYAMISSTAQVVGLTIGAVIGKFVFGDIYISLVLMAALFVIAHIIYFSYLFKAMKVSSGKYVLYSLVSVITIVVLSALVRWISEFIFGNL
ncbi:oligosaccharide flippase family protein [Paenibacillus oceani]|uniref:Oligosaccharide flippase family protein n=1 Tax=Paenibacillus oceani TaxID=2772510 RepID=A0A927H391_9BACL|nr:oligosaccharide flippase family protein [Paenibacillus oceani]MBD2866178.1 oligosaccharide flippase family protein [Paenibacillus oceani]